MPATQQAIFGLRSRNTFDSLGGGIGAIWWPPIEGFLPLLGITNSASGFGIRIVLVRWSKGDVQAFGFRLEEPHGSSGKHSFHHVQLVRRLQKNAPSTEIINRNLWMPDTQPSFPLQATSPLELLWAAAVSVYGKEEAHEPFHGGTPGVRKSLNEYLAELK
jgi:hypothetical protein